MPALESASLSRPLRVLYLLTILTWMSGMTTASAQTDASNQYYARKNSFGILTAYSADSSHILLGNAENRMLLNIGVSYGRRFFLNKIVNWQYNGELLPVALESDPLTSFVNHQTSPTVATYSGSGAPPRVSCATITTPYSIPVINSNGGITIYSGTQTIFCSGRQWTIGEAISPVGMQLNFLTRRMLQPFIIGHGGYMYSTHPIPTISDGSFNFTFDFGAGFELYHSGTKSIRTEYRYHHISNHNTANLNPGIDNGLFQVTYSFGR